MILRGVIFSIVSWVQLTYIILTSHSCACNLQHFETPLLDVVSDLPTHCHQRVRLQLTLLRMKTN